MFRRVVLIFLIMCAAFLPAQAKEFREVTGIEWLQMSLSDRNEQVLAGLFMLSSQGVRCQKSPDEYYKLLHEELRSAPSLGGLSVTNVLASIIYEEEPSNRAVLDGMRKKPVVKQIETH